MKKNIYIICAFITSIQFSRAQEAPGIGGGGLPWDIGEGGDSGVYDNSPFERFANIFTSELIKFVAAAAVIALMISGLMLIISGGEEEKFKKAKTWFIWSLVGVFISLSAWFLINFLNNLSIGSTSLPPSDNNLEQDRAEFTVGDTVVNQEGQ